MTVDAYPVHDEAILEAALEWHMRAEAEGATDRFWQEFTAWLEASPAHAEALQTVERLALDIEDNRFELSEMEKPRTAVILPFPVRRIPKKPTIFSSGRRTAAAAGLAAAVCVAVGVGVWRISEGSVEVYRTGVGETRSLVLADGSRIRLDAASTLKVQLGWFTRRVTMGQAEATFDITHNPNRPFVIAVADQSVRVVGTEFNIRNFDGAVDVTVRRGTVTVSQPSRGSAPIARLTAGWALNHRIGDAQSTQTAVNPESAFAWTDGRIVCSDRPLSEVVADLNRHYAKPIRLSPGVGDRRFTGVLELGDQDDIIRRLEAYLSLSAHGSNGEIVLS